jgi:hypothetical protein
MTRGEVDGFDPLVATLVGVNMTAAIVIAQSKGDVRERVLERQEEALRHIGRRSMEASVELEKRGFDVTAAYVRVRDAAKNKFDGDAH